MDPEQDDLKALLALARGGSVAAPARTLEVDHSNSSRRLATLEEAFAAQLLVSARARCQQRCAVAHTGHARTHGH
jgi:DNA-binding transcriptional LysR family regulator